MLLIVTGVVVVLVVIVVVVLAVVVVVVAVVVVVVVLYTQRGPATSCISKDYTGEHHGKVKGAGGKHSRSEPTYGDQGSS